MSKAYELIGALTHLSRQFASPDYDVAIEHFKGELPFETYLYGAEQEHNGWVIPPKYEVQKALIKRNGTVIYDGMSHALGVPCHAAAFRGTVDRDTLKKHLWYDHRFPEAIPYHFRFSYRPWERDWGFCVPQTFYDSLSDDLYDIELDVHEGDKELKILEHVVPGSSGIEFAFIAHLDHPGMANDDLAGCAVGVELFQALAGRDLRHTYRLLLVQEILGSEIHLHAQPRLRALQEGLFLEMLGVNRSLVVQRARSTPTAMELALKEGLSERNIVFEEVGFRESAQNDEIVFESYGVPTVALTRFPYPEYHSSRDNMSIIEQARLTEAVQVLQAVVDWHESDVYVERLFEGVACLSNPRINLYVDPGQPALGENLSGVAMHRFMEQICLLNGRSSVKVLASRCGVPFQDACRYLRLWEQRNLVRLL